MKKIYKVLLVFALLFFNIILFFKKDFNLINKEQKTFFFILTGIVLLLGNGFALRNTRKKREKKLKNGYDFYTGRNTKKKRKQGK